MNWRLAPTIGLVALLAPAMAHAQTNLDQGKSASQIFAAACVECHKAPRGLAKGRNSAALTDFLREHYTTSRTQAAALAAYVLGGRGAEPVGGAAQGKGQKPAAERADRGAPAQEEAEAEQTPGAAVQTRGGRPQAKPSRTRSLRSSRRSNSCRVNGRQRPRRGVGAGSRRCHQSPMEPAVSCSPRLPRLWQSLRQKLPPPAEAKSRADTNTGNFDAGRCGVRGERASAARQHPRLRTLDFELRRISN